MSTYSCSSISPEAFCCQSSDNLSRKLCVFMGLLRPSTTFRWGKGKKKKGKNKKAGGGSTSSSFSMQVHSLQEKFTPLLWKAFSYKNAILFTPLPHNFHTTWLFAKECKITPGSVGLTHRVSLSKGIMPQRCTFIRLGTRESLRLLPSTSAQMCPAFPSLDLLILLDLWVLNVCQ